MPSLPVSMQQSLVIGHSSSSNSDIIETEVNNQLHHSDSISASSSSNRLNDGGIKNYCNRKNSKIKLLVRSHAMKESMSPLLEPQNDSTSSPQIFQLVDNDAIDNVAISSSQNNLTSSINKFTNSNNLTSDINISNGKHQQLNNNNDPIYNSNVSAINQSSNQMRNSITSPTCRILSRNGSSCSQPHQKTFIFSFNNNKFNSQKANKNNINVSSKCNNYDQNRKHYRPILFQTSTSPSKNKSFQKNTQNNKINEQRRPNTLTICNNQYSTQCGNSSVNRSNSRHKLRHQNSSSQGSYDNASSSLSRDISTELYKDSTGIDLEQFIAETINRNQKDRTVLLKIEKDLIEFAKDRQKVSYKFPNMSSYNRMLVHRVAAYFGMEHNVDQPGLSVIVTRTKNMRIPDTRFKEHIRDDLFLSEEPRRSILKRDSSSFEDTFNFKSPDRLSGDYCRRSKSFEEREEEYEKVRRRIFKDNSGENSELTSWPYWSSSESSESSARYRLIYPSDNSVRQTKLLKEESFDSRDSFRSNSLRPSVSKSYSFGGYTRGMLSRGDSVMSTHSAGGRLMKQDSGTSICSRLSPSSSGYKSQSQRSDTTISPSPSPSPISNNICNDSQISSQHIVSSELNNQTVIWAVTSISNVPPGSVIINPKTNQPHTNPDGSLYRFDPDNPPKLFIENGKTQGINLSPKHSKISEAQSIIFNSKNDNGKRQRSETTKHSNNCSSNTITSTITASMTTTTMVTNLSHLTNSATPKEPFISKLTSLSPPLLHQRQPQPQSQLQHQQQQSHQSQQQQPLLKVITVQPCNYSYAVQPCATYIPTSESYSQNVYQHNVTQQTVTMAPHSTQGQPTIPNNGQKNIYNQNPVLTNYVLPIQHRSVSQTGDVTELSNYFMGINLYDQQGAGDSQTIYSYPYSSYHTSGSNQMLTNDQSIQSNYWQTSANQMTTQQTMYFIPSSETTVFVNHNPNNRQLSQQQRISSSYSINLQTMTPPSQSNANYMNNYPVHYNSLSTVTPSSNECTSPPLIHMVPAYSPEQSEIQSSAVVYRGPTPLNTPNINQIPNIPLMYLNSGNYLSPTATFGHIVGPSSTSAPSGTYMAPTLIPNLIFNQNLITGSHTLTPGNCQRDNKSPTPAHELFDGRNVEKSVQLLHHYPIPMYQDAYIVQGDMRLMQPRIIANSRLQYTPVSSLPVVEGYAQSYRPLFYSSNTSFDGRNQKISKQRSKFATLPLTATQLNLYKSPSMTSFFSNTPKDIREMKPVEDNVI